MPGKKWLKWQGLLGLLIGLCALILVLHGPNQSAPGISAPVSISPGNENYALVPIPLRTQDSPRKARFGENDIYPRMASLEAAPPTSWVERYLTLNPGALFEYLSDFVTIFRGESRQACQLLDIPPPSHI